MSRPFRYCTILLVLSLLSVSCHALDKTEVYTTSRMSMDESGALVEVIDTIGMITYDVAPHYLRPTTLEVTVYPIGHLPDSTTLCVSGFAGAFRFASHENTWYGDYDQGDQLTYNIEFTPLRVGSMSIHLEAYCNGYSCYDMQYGFTLDESGNLTPDPMRDQPAIAVLGPIADVFGDTLFEAEGSYTSAPKSINSLHILSKIYPVPTLGHTSTLEYLIVPNSDIDQGLFWRLTYNDIFHVEVLGGEEWTDKVFKGDTLRVKLAVTPLRTGLGSFLFTANGYMGTSERSPNTQEMAVANLPLYLPFDESQGLLALTKHELRSPFNSKEERHYQRSDEMRLDEIKAIDIRTRDSVICSPSFETKLDEIVQSRRESNK